MDGGGGEGEWTWVRIGGDNNLREIWGTMPDRSRVFWLTNVGSIGDTKTYTERRRGAKSEEAERRRGGEVLASAKKSKKRPTEQTLTTWP
jgi:hypothetical protein